MVSVSDQDMNTHLAEVSRVRVFWIFFVLRGYGVHSSLNLTTQEID